MYHTIIDAHELNHHLNDANWRIIDCHFDLMDTDLGRKLYLSEHIPGAIYAHLDNDLSGYVVPGETGRHPLPTIAGIAALLGQWGIDNNTQVIVYDDKKGAIAARVWWMFRYLGHEQVAVLNGGFTHWKKAGFATNNDIPTYNRRSFVTHVQEQWVKEADVVATWSQQPSYSLVDSRTPERYRGEEEPIDPVAGHIPGAINMPFSDNWDEHGLLKSPAQLRERFANLPPAEKTIFYCGSGVTACHNILAYAHAGLGDACLYPGSWSEWTADGKRPVAVGDS
jgi:thiosulfate/3-mercaptopyruvate sulfurtransferase